MINRQNYEEFFLLYADGELSATDKQAVALFVQENIDLADEFAVYQQTKLPVEHFAFEDKNTLYRFAEKKMDVAAYEEAFLLALDNELGRQEKDKLNSFLSEHPFFQETFNQLTQTKLPIEVVLFPDKSSLYHKEDKPVIYLHRWKIAVAAALIGLVVLLWTIVPGYRSPEALVAKNSTSEKPNGLTKKGNSVSVTPGTDKDQTTTDISDKNPAVLASNNITRVTKDLSDAGIQNEDVSTNMPSVTKPIEETIIPSRAESTEVNSASEKILANNTAPIINSDAVRVTDRIDENSGSAITARQAVYKELDTEDEKKSLYLGSIEINKDKLRGFFRKASTLFRSKAKQEEDSKSENLAVNGNRSLR